VREPACPAPIGDAELVAYWLGDLDERAETRVEEHVLGCATCAAELEALVRLGEDVRDAFARGAVSAVVGAALVQRLRAAGCRLREYRVPANGSVHCTIAPDDDLVVARLQASLKGVTRLDLVDIGPDGLEWRLEDVPFDAAAGEVLVTPRADLLRLAGDHLHRMRLVDASSQRMIGEYAFLHSAWRE
jgi:hypothetical protein